MKLEDIGFYTLSDARAENSSVSSPLWRCELILTDMCNFNCRYCRGLRKDIAGTMPFDEAIRVLSLWVSEGLTNVRFSGGEPTMYQYLPELVSLCRLNNVEGIAVSTNGSQSFEYYDDLIERGVNDFSISLDGGCCSVGDAMAGVLGQWEHVTEVIKYVSERVYTTVGMVFTDDNVDESLDAVLFAHSLGVADIRVISAAQYNKALGILMTLPESVLSVHPILNYRVQNFKTGRNVRGIQKEDSNQCSLVLDDMAIAGKYHFPCIIYMREGGDPIGEVGDHMRTEREKWYKNHDTHKDPICQKMCLDVCIDHNNKCVLLKDEKRV